MSHQEKSTSSEAGPIQMLFEEYLAMETTCEAALQDHDEITTHFFRRGDSAIPHQGNEPLRLVYGEFRETCVNLSKPVGKRSVGQVVRAVAAADTGSIGRLQAVEVRIRDCRLELSTIEQRILDMPVTSMAEALCKLRFMAGVMFDGAEFEPLYFAYLVEECFHALKDAAPRQLPPRILSWQSAD